MRTQFEHELKNYMHETERQARLHALKICYEPHGLREGIPLDAARLARYQVLEESFEKIALDSIEEFGDKGVTPQAVGQGVKRFAELIGVSLRPGSRGGRPRKR